MTASTFSSINNPLNCRHLAEQLISAWYEIKNNRWNSKRDIIQEGMNKRLLRCLFSSQFFKKNDLREGKLKDQLQYQPKNKITNHPIWIVQVSSQLTEWGAFAYTTDNAYLSCNRSQDYQIVGGVTKGLAKGADFCQGRTQSPALPFLGGKL